MKPKTIRSNQNCSVDKNPYKVILSGFYEQKNVEIFKIKLKSA